MLNILDLPYDVFLLICKNLKLIDKYNLYLTNEYLSDFMLREVFYKLKAIGFEIFDTSSEIATEEFRWKCSDKIHHVQDSDQIEYNQFQGIGCKRLLEKILKLTPNLESLDLRSCNIDKKLIKTIIRRCKKLNCIQLNSSIFECHCGWNLMIKKLLKKLRHITIDNKILCQITPYASFSLVMDLKEFFTKAKLLEELVIYIHPFEEVGALAFDFESLKNITKKLILFNANVFSDYEILDEDYSYQRFIVIQRVIKYLAESEAKQLKYLRLNSSIDVQTIDPRFIWKNFENLIHLSITAPNYVYPPLPATQESLINLKYLTLILDDPEMLYDLTRHLPQTKSLDELSIINVGNQIEFLKICGGDLKSFKILNQKYENLKCLKLYNTQFNSFDTICNLKYLEILKINFEKDYDFDIEDQFTDRLMNELQIIVKNCKNMRKISIHYWSGFGDIQKKAFLEFLINYKNIIFKNKY